MSDNTSVYVVTEGEYSDYHIVGVFDDKATADAFAERRNERARGRWDLNDVEEYTLNELAPVAQGDLLAWTVRILANGKVERAFSEVDVCPEDADPDLHPPFGVESSFLCHTMQSSEEAAIKVCAERVAQRTAEKAGIT